MKELDIKRKLDGSTRMQGVLVEGKTYSLHITDDKEVIITDLYDYSKIYSIQSLDFYNLLERADIKAETHNETAKTAPEKQQESDTEPQKCPNCGKQMEHETESVSQRGLTTGIEEDDELSSIKERYCCKECKITYDGIQWKVPDDMLPTDKQKKTLQFINSRLDMDLEAITKHQCWMVIGQYFDKAKQAPEPYKDDDYYVSLQEYCGMSEGDFC